MTYLRQSRRGRFAAHSLVLKLVGENAMKPEDFLNLRKVLGYTQEEAGQKLGVDRSTIQNWERGATRIPRIADLACRELMRRWKRRPEFGPVALVYAVEAMRPKGGLLHSGGIRSMRTVPQ